MEYEAIREKSPGSEDVRTDVQNRDSIKQQESRRAADSQITVCLQFALPAATPEREGERERERDVFSNGEDIDTYKYGHSERERDACTLAYPHARARTHIHTHTHTHTPHARTHTHTHACTHAQFRDASLIVVSMRFWSTIV